MRSPTRTASTSSGQLAYYGARAARAGKIVIILANSPEFVAAKAGAKASFGTNPLCFAHGTLFLVCPVRPAKHLCKRSSSKRIQRAATTATIDTLISAE